MTNLDKKLNSINSDIRFGVCECYSNGLCETSIFFNENFDGKLNKELSDRFVLCPRQEIQETVSRSIDFKIAYKETFKKFKQWLLDNNITHSIEC